MPQINRIRVNNVKYNFGSQFYDDFMMRFSGKNTIYDLANGGGKSVLMLLLMQNMIPNCTLDEKQPIEKLFRSENGCTTIHSLIEWNLSEPFQKNNYKYMLTGFCARKAKNEETEGEHTAAIEYFNYVIFYRQYNENDIKNLPLSVPGKKNPEQKERITYQGLKNYLRELGRRDLSLEVRIFERKGDYQRFIAGYGIYESEWEIIRGINRTEGHVRTYFESNYKTTRKVVEDLLIEEIIEKSFKNRMLSEDSSERQENVMAETLIGIKDKLLDLSKKKDEIHKYDAQTELLGGFMEGVADIKNLYLGRKKGEKELARAYHTFEDEKEKAQALRNRNRQKKESIAQGIMDEQRAVDTVQILEKEERIKTLSKEYGQLQEQEGELQQRKEGLQQQLQEAESMNDYLDYLYYKKEGDRVREGLEKINEDKGMLAAELTDLATEKKRRDDLLLQELNEKIKQETEVHKKAEAAVLEMEECRKELEKELAVDSYKQQELTDLIEQENAGIAEEKKLLGLLLVSDMKEEQRNSGDMYTLLLQNQQNLEIKQKQTGEKKWQVAQKEAEYQKQKEFYEMRLEELAPQVAHFLSIQEERKRLGEIYQVSHEEHLEGKIRSMRDETLRRIQELHEETERELAYEQALKEGNPVSMDKNREKVLQYIRNYYEEDAVSGGAYLKSLDYEERKRLLEECPILPHAIVVKKQFSEITGDEKLEHLLGPEHMFVLIEEEALLNGTCYLPDGMTASMFCRELFYEEEVIQDELLAIEDRREKRSRELAHREESLKTLERDVQFLERYPEEEKRGRMAQEEKQKLKRETEGLLLLIRENKETYQECAKLEEKLGQDMESLQAQVDEIKEKLALLARIFEAMEREEKAEKQREELSLHLQEAKKEIRNLEGRAQAWHAKKETARERLQYLENRCKEIRKQQERYGFYARAEYVPTRYAALAEDVIESRLFGTMDAYEGESRDVADKRKLLENYELAMHKSLQAIDYKGVELAKIEATWQQGKGMETPKEKLLQLRNESRKQEEELLQLRRKQDGIATEKNRMEGAVAHGKEAILQKYGIYEQIDFSEVSAEEYVKEKRRKMDALRREEEQLQQEWEETEQKMKAYEFMLHDFEQVMTDRIWKEYPDEIWEDREALSERGEKVLQEMKKYQKSVQDRRELFEKEKSFMIKNLRNMDCEALADEMEVNAQMPEDEEMTERLYQGIGEIRACLNLEKERIQKSVEDIARLKKNFESQCIQTCMNVRTELEKLPKLSGIVLDGEKVSMLSLMIPYVREEDLELRMSEYIDDTMEQADALKTEAERVRFIRNRLSWKHLFGVIVTDMNRIQLKLYKRERIREQSKYLKYEEAVGSTGQSQGIYIQFLIAIVHYITSLNTKMTENADIGKVIFIDNPFGAAKDIYIWEPIFSLLQTNHVQLIVPCRGATPAITGRFDVNYILGQRLVNGKQQTVVVNYYSHVDTEELEYETLQFTQESFQWDE